MESVCELFLCLFVEMRDSLVKEREALMEKLAEGEKEHKVRLQL